VALLRHIAIALYTNMLYNTCMVTKTVVKSKNNVTYSCIFHIVWCPKYRRSVLIEDVAERLKQILREVAQETRCDLIELEVMPDHVHVLVGIDPQFGIHRLTKLMKGRSSRLLRQEFPKLKSRLPTLWTNSYFVSTVGGAPWSIIKQYIENQKNV
jgi:putative transposase